jgi:crossover junction endodeoxyribonuclease RusA
MIEFEIPWPQSVNHYKQVGRIVRTKTGKLYQKRINTPETNQFYYAVWIKVKARGVKFGDSARLGMWIDLYPPDKRKRDIDNLCKVVLDGFQKAELYKDDNMIDLLVIERKEIVPGGSVIVKIKQLP